LDFLCLTTKFSLFKLFDLIRREILNDFNAEVEAGLTPCKTDKLEELKLSKYKAQSVRLSDDYENKTPVEVFTDEKGIYIQKYEPECLICGSGENIKVLNGKKLCRVCYEKLAR